ncbi:hypothetical protein BRAO375_1450038 [Bradyrhizobium sp. ORS 375]|nr:hypothetical protein [Bradyrhizobium sp. ORS 375]CCD91316.1 hypothetical protein BRAO375_1450038 [Bradyrhizobium sp. ORS 375]
MPGLVPGIHVVLSVPTDVDGRDKPGHDDVETSECITPTVECNSSGVLCPSRWDATKPVMLDETTFDDA